MPGWIHIVGFKFRPELSEEDRQDVIDSLLALKSKSLRDGRPCIMAMHHGPSKKLYPWYLDLDHVFTIHFATKDDCDYYHDQCEAHKAFLPKAIAASDPTKQGLTVGFAPVETTVS